MYQQPPYQPPRQPYPYPYPGQPQPRPPSPRGHPVPIIAFVAAGVLIACLASCVFLGLASLLDPSSGATANHQPMLTPAPTSSAPQPTATLQQQYLQLLADQAPDDTIALSVDAKTGAVTINDNIGEQLSTSAAVTICKARAYYLLRALFTEATPTPSRVTLRILGPASDAQGNTDPNSLYARVDLSAKTAQRLNWPNLSPSSAWNVYDDAQLAPGLVG